MKRTLLFSISALTVLVLASCEQPSVEEEVDDICECVKSAETNKDMKRCRVLMNEISDKYAFDPEAAETVKKRLKECASN